MRFDDLIVAAVAILIAGGLWAVGTGWVRAVAVVFTILGVVSLVRALWGAWE